MREQEQRKFDPRKRPFFAHLFCGYTPMTAGPIQLITRLAGSGTGVGGGVQNYHAYKLLKYSES